MKNKLLLFLSIALFSCYEVIAQLPPILPGDSGSGGNVNDTPIHLLIYPFLLLGVYLGYKNFNKR